MARSAASTDVTRDLDAIKEKISGLKLEIKSANADVKSLNQSLKLDPTNVEYLSQKWNDQKYIIAQLNAQIELHKQTIASLQEQSSKNASGADTYNNAIKSEQIEIKKLTTNVDALNKAYNDQTLATAKSAANLTNTSKSLDAYINKTNFAAKALKVLAVAITAATYKIIEQGAELASLATKYGTTAETLQYQENLYAQLTDSADNYTSALSSMTNVIRSLNRGTGSTNAYGTALRKLGISLSTIKNSTAAEAYELIFAALQKVSDATERANIATVLFGDNGNNVAVIAGQTSETLSKLNEELKAAGLISNDDASALKELSNKLTLVKSSLYSAGAEILVSFSPALIALAGLLKNLASFMASDFGKGFSAFTITLLAGIAVTNQLAKLIKPLISLMALLAAAKAKDSTLTTIAAIKQAIYNGQLSMTVIWLSAITLGLTLAAAAAAAIYVNSQNAASSIDGLTDSTDKLKESLDSIGSGGSVIVKNAASSTTEQKIKVSVDVNATGDTPVSQSNAQIIGKSIEASINEKFGAIIGSGI